jgi:hypothetical protein
MRHETGRETDRGTGRLRKGNFFYNISGTVSPFPSSRCHWKRLDSNPRPKDNEEKVLPLCSRRKPNGTAHFQKCKQLFEYKHLLLL